MYEATQIEVAVHFILTLLVAGGGVLYVLIGMWMVRKLTKNGYRIIPWWAIYAITFFWPVVLPSMFLFGLIVKMFFMNWYVKKCRHWEKKRNSFLTINRQRRSLLKRRR